MPNEQVQVRQRLSVGKEVEEVSLAIRIAKHQIRKVITLIKAQFWIARLKRPEQRLN